MTEKKHHADPLTRAERAARYLKMSRSTLTPAQNRRLRKKENKAMARG